MLEDTYKRFNKGKGRIHHNFINWQLSLSSPTDVRKPRICEAANKCPEARQFLDYLNGMEVEMSADDFQHTEKDTAEKRKISLQERVNNILEKGRSVIKANSKENGENMSSIHIDNKSR